MVRDVPMSFSMVKREPVEERRRDRRKQRRELVEVRLRSIADDQLAVFPKFREVSNSRAERGIYFAERIRGGFRHFPQEGENGGR